MAASSGKARFVIENYGESELARRFGVTRYPAVFVGDVLVATPSDFGFYGREGGAGGRYAPIRKAESHERFRADLARMIDLLAAGRGDDARRLAAPADAASVAALPAFVMKELSGAALDAGRLRGRPVLVEFWATWCPPCRGTLQWLGETKKRHGGALEVVAVAVESEEPAVRAMADELGLPGVRWAMGIPEVARAFGDISAVPTLFLFGADGRLVQAFYGAPPGLHADVEKALAAVMGE